MEQYAVRYIGLSAGARLLMRKPLDSAKGDEDVICLRCGSEYVEGVVECPECGVLLVEATPAEVSTEGLGEPVVVFSSNSASVVAVAKSLLIDAGIEFGVAGENVQDLFGYGRFPAGASVFAGPVRLFVAPADANAAGQLLARLGEGTAESADPDGDSSDEPVRTLHSIARLVAKAFAVLALGLAAFEALAALANVFGQ